MIDNITVLSPNLQYVMLFKRIPVIQYRRFRCFFTLFPINSCQPLLEKTMNKRSNSAITQNLIITNLIARLQTAEHQLQSITNEIKSIKNELGKLEGTDNNDSFEYLNSSSKKVHYDFTRENEFVVVFTDGACENNGKANARAGIGVWFGRNHPLNISKPVDGRPTNNTAEIQACIHAIKTAHANGVTKLKIKTDSEFVINSMTKWIFKWKTNNWKVASGGDVKNKEDFVILDTSLKLMDKVIWEHVDAHKGIEGNESADNLAKNGALSYCTK